MVHYHCPLSLYTVTIHCHCTLSMNTVNAVTGYCHCTWYTVFWNRTLSLHTAHYHCTLSQYTITVHCHCTLCTLYSPRSHRMYPHTQCVRHNGQDSTLALYTVTLHSLYALTVHCPCTVSVYTVTVNLVRFFLEGPDGNLSPLGCSPLTPPPPHSYSRNPKNSCSQSESCNCSLRHSQGHTH